MRGYTESDIEDLREAIAELEAKNLKAVVKMETLRKQRDDLLAACEAQAKFDQHAVHCDRCGRAEKYCDPGWQLWNTAGNLRNQAIAKAKGDQCTA